MARMKKEIELKKMDLEEKVVLLPELEQETPLELESAARIRPELYWEWRTTIEEMEIAKLKKRIVNLEKELLAKHIENHKLKLDLFKDHVTAADKVFQTSETSYLDMVKRIEAEIGMSLKDCAINELFEVKKL